MIRFNFPECLSILLEHGADVNLTDKKGQTALHCACWAHNVECLKLLLGSGRISINQKSNYGKTVLHYIFNNFWYWKDDIKARAQVKECIKMLLDYGIDIYETDNQGQTAFDLRNFIYEYSIPYVKGALH